VPIRLFNTRGGIAIEIDGRLYASRASGWDALINVADVEGAARVSVAGLAEIGAEAIDEEHLLPPIESQEVWAAGVTYFRSRTARMEEARAAGGEGGSFYDRVYGAPRPELFFKATPHRVVGPGGRVRVRADSRWTVPEPELALVVNARGAIVGCTIGNDMSARDIEGENPLYLPQAKVYAESCALGPAVLLGRASLDPDTRIELEIRREGQTVFAGETRVAMMKRSADELVEYLRRDNVFPAGCVLLTGTGIVPPDEVSVRPGDEIRITIAGIGTLRNVAHSPLLNLLNP
jgi:2-dehydro-3-deoxy-D-arabinonate dehydratase